MKLKICGLTKPEEAVLVAKAGADYAGIVMFFPKSKRNMEPEQATRILAALPKSVQSVAVVVSPTLEQVRIIEDLGFAMIQIHGTVEPQVVETLKIPFIRAFNGETFAEIESYGAMEKCIGFVFDAAEPGSGKTFDWSVLKQVPRTDKLILLSGGLTTENVVKAMETVQPDGVDVSSGVEYTDGRPGKDPEKIASFAAKVKSFCD